MFREDADRWAGVGAGFKACANTPDLRASINTRNKVANGTGGGGGARSFLPCPNTNPWIFSCFRVRGADNFSLFGKVNVERFILPAVPRWKFRARIR